MNPEPNTPVIVGAAAVQQRVDDPTVALEAMLLMRAALEQAADDAGARALLDSASELLMMQGTWNSANPVSVVAPWNPTIRSVVAGVGVLQQTLLNRACAAVASGESDIVLVCGGEAKYRALQTQISGTPDGWIADTVTVGAPDERMVPAHEIVTRPEIERGLRVPARQYAMIDTALRRANGLTPAEHIGELAALWSGFSVVAASNPDAWSHHAVEPALLSAPSARNPMMAWPYTKLHCSQWNVDQAAGLIVCSVTAAERFGVPRDRWVFAHVGIESNAMVPLTLRAEPHRSPAAAVAADVLRERLGAGADEIEHRDIYSCFPAAVRVQAAELGLRDAQARPLTVTGGMTFGGGPFNNYTLQAMAKMVHVLRGRGGRGLVTNVSGLMTKFGLSVWSASPPEAAFAAVDISNEAAAATAVAEFDDSYGGPADVITYTVACDKGAAVEGIVLARNPTGAHVLASTTDLDLMADMMMSEWCDRRVTVDGAQLLAT